MKAAAVAQLVGVSDPLAFLDKSPEDWMIQIAVIQEAWDLLNERRKAEIEAIGVAVGNTVGSILARALR